MGGEARERLPSTHGRRANCGGAHGALLCGFWVAQRSGRGRGSSGVCPVLWLDGRHNHVDRSKRYRHHSGRDWPRAGYSHTQVFRKIIFPQAAQQFLPQLVGQFVSLVKDTSIVGYIAVQDLTRASDLIRSRTMDAFFPLVSTAIIYFLFCRLLAWALGLLAAKVDPSNQSRKIKGVRP